MKIQQLLAAALLVAGTSIASAQKLSEQQRLDSIWYAASNRMSQQCDSWYSRGEYLRCIQLLKIETTIFPYDFDSVSLLGWFQQSTEDEAGELATYVAFRRNNAGDSLAPYLEAMFYYRKKLYAKVPPLLEPLIKATPHPDASVYRQLAHCYEDMNLLSDSKRIWQAFLAIAPNDPAAKTNLSRVEKKLKGEVPLGAPSRKNGKA
jgi:tetratricopeptide (TPR) repeat protein